MSRLVKIVRITDKNRDEGKTFVLREMLASAGEAWATQALLLLAQEGVESAKAAEGAGMAGLAAVSAESITTLKVMQSPLLLGWRDCVKYQHHPDHPLQKIKWDEESCVIEEISTITKLRAAVWELHLAPFTNDIARTSDLPSTVQPA